jgi:GMP synthase-like glutamine amidotransferase
MIRSRAGSIKALILQHLPWEGPGIIGSCLHERSIPSRIVRLYRNDAIPFDDVKNGGYGVIIGLGSSSTAYKPETNLHHDDETQLFRLIRRLGIPSFDICYSMQLFCMANGGRVASNPSGKEVGFFDLHLTANGREDQVTGQLGDFGMLQWHGDHVTRLPEGASHLAYSRITKYQVAVVDHIHYLVQGDGQASRPAMLKSWFKNDAAWAVGRTDAKKNDILHEARLKKSYYESSYRRLFENFLIKVARQSAD